jgi:hypothetical protein
LTTKARLGCRIALVALSFVVAPSAWAGPTNSDKPSDLVFWHSQLELIKQEESRGNWSKAYEFYAYLLSIDRNQPEIKQRFLHSLRNLHRRYRHSDLAFRQGLLNPQFRLTESLDFYRDMVRRVQELYQDDDKVRTGRLFRESVEELVLAFDDPEFRKVYLKDVSPISVLEFRNYLRSTYGVLRVTGLAEAAEHVRAIAKEASKRLGMPGQLVVVEMACGVCNCLDEHSFYLTPSELISGHLDRTVEFSPVENGVGIIRVFGFQEASTIQELDVALDQFRMAGMKVLILDLRSNAGGSLDVAVQVAERFLNAPAPIATTSGKISKTFQSFSMQSVDAPLIVLVDGNTASAAELLAGALKAHGRAELVGQTTYGKSEVQKLVRFDQGPQGALRITWAKFHIHKTHDLAKDGGITPDLAVSPATAMGAPDTQLDAARSRARSLMMR